jgi:hypothetical protein
VASKRLVFAWGESGYWMDDWGGVLYAACHALQKQKQIVIARAWHTTVQIFKYIYQSIMRNKLFSKYVQFHCVLLMPILLNIKMVEQELE